MRKKIEQGQNVREKAENKEGQVVVLCLHMLSSVDVLPALLESISSQQRVNNRVNGLLEVLNEDSVPCHYSLFYHIYITGTLFNINKLK